MTVYTGTPEVAYINDTLNDSSRVWQNYIYVNVSVIGSNFNNIVFELSYSNNTEINSTTYTDINDYYFVNREGYNG